ncbi:hypothetical protein KEJ26_04095 [Candidatus Bathyarchaeota archaeon]|nr:hypothetical protein [Candidatus Bathyarchaeota archaeon]
MAELIEKTLTTLLALLIVASAGIQIINTGSRVVEDCYKTLLVNQLTTNLDNGIWRIFIREVDYYSFKIFCPNKLRIHADGNKVIIEYLAFEQWHVDRRTYPILIRILREPTKEGTYFVALSRSEREVLVNFLEV